MVNSAPVPGGFGRVVNVPVGVTNRPVTSIDPAAPLCQVTRKFVPSKARLGNLSAVAAVAAILNWVPGV